MGCLLHLDYPGAHQVGALVGFQMDTSVIFITLAHCYLPLCSFTGVGLVGVRVETSPYTSFLSDQLGWEGHPANNDGQKAEQTVWLWQCQQHDGRLKQNESS